MKRFKNFLKGLGIVAATGAASSAGQVLTSGEFDARKLGGAAAGGAAIALAAWLMRSPLHPPDFPAPQDPPAK